MKCWRRVAAIVRGRWQRFPPRAQPAALHIQPATQCIQPAAPCIVQVVDVSADSAGAAAGIELHMPSKLAAEVSLLAAAAEIDPKPQHVDRQRSLSSAAAHYTRRLELTWLALGGSGWLWVVLGGSGWRSRALEEPPCRVKSTGGRDPGTGTSPGKRSGSRGVDTPGSSPRGRSSRTPRLSSPRLSSPPPHRTGRPPRLSPYPRRRRTRRSSWPMSSLPPRRRGPRASGCSPGGRRSLRR